MVYYRQHNAIEWEKAKWDAEVEVRASAAGDTAAAPQQLWRVGESWQWKERGRQRDRERSDGP